MTGDLLAGIPLGTSPSNVAVGEGAVWVLDAEDRTVSRIDPETRASVARELFETRIEAGMLGDIRFDRYGDLVEGPVTIYRITGDGAVVDRVITTTANP